MGTTLYADKSNTRVLLLAIVVLDLNPLALAADDACRVEGWAPLPADKHPAAGPEVVLADEISRPPFMVAVVEIDVQPVPVDYLDRPGVPVRVAGPLRQDAVA